MDETGQSEAERVVDGQVEAYVAGDAKRFAAFYAEDARCVNLPGGEAVAEGRAAIETVWGEMFARRKARFELVRRISLGEFVIDHERIIREPDGQAFEAIAAYHVRDGLIQEVWFPAPPSR